MLGRCFCLVGVAALIFGLGRAQGDDEKPGGLQVDKKAKTVTIACTIAPRQLPKFKQVYPLEVFACWPSPKGQKSHETAVVFDEKIKPSEVHKALESIGLKAGKPALGETGKASGAEVKIFLEFKKDDKTVKAPIEETMIDTKSGKTMPKVKWLFTGSAVKFPDPEKCDKAYGADLSGTLITIYPVSDDTVFQTHLGGKDEGKWRLETNKELLPKEGTAVKLIIQGS